MEDPPPLEGHGPPSHQGRIFRPSGLEELPPFYQPGRLHRCEQLNHRCSLFRDFRRSKVPVLGGVSSGGPSEDQCHLPPQPECPRQEQDIVFLIDGSGSINFRDFAKMLSFVKAVMSQFQRPSAQVCGRGGREVRGLPQAWGPGQWPWCQPHAAPPVLPDAVL